MGDGGSMLIGILVLYLLYLGTQSSSSFKPTTALWLCAFPIMDMVSTVIRRVIEKRPVFAASQDHLHHIMIDRGLSTFQVLRIITLTSVFFAMLGIGFELTATNEVFVWVLFVMAFLLYYFILDAIAKQNRKSGP